MGAFGDVQLARGEFEAALVASEHAVVLAPNDPLMLAHRGRILGYAGQVNDGVAAVKAPMRMSPTSLSMLFILGANYRVLGQYGDAIQALLEHRKRLGGKVVPAPSEQLIAALVQDGQDAAAEDLADHVMTAYPTFSVRVASRYAYRDPIAQATFPAALRCADIPG